MALKSNKGDGMIIDETQDVYNVPESTRVLVKGLGGKAIIVKTVGGGYSVILQFPTIGGLEEAKWVLGHLTSGQDA